MKSTSPILTTARTTGVWAVRVLFALGFAAVLGGLPVYIHKEINELRHLERELTEIKKLNKRLFVDLEDSAVRLESLKSPRGIRRIMRERGYAPAGSVVYQIEPHVDLDHTQTVTEN